MRCPFFFCAAGFQKCLPVFLGSCLRFLRVLLTESIDFLVYAFFQTVQLCGNHFDGGDIHGGFDVCFLCFIGAECQDARDRADYGNAAQLLCKGLAGVQACGK